MSFDPTRHHRRSIRLPTYPYTSGTFFITICTYMRECTLGKIVDETTVYSPMGRIVAEEWVRSAQIRAEITLDEWVVMPNHLHAIVMIAPLPPALPPDRAHSRAPLPRSLGALVGAFKAAATTRINAGRNTPGVPVWQRNYYEHVIRNRRELTSIRAYVADNPRRWHEDDEHPARLR